MVVAQPHMPAAARAPVRSAGGRWIVPSLVAIAATYAVGAYVHSQLNRESNVMDKIYAKQNTPEAEEVRRKGFLVDTNPDPRGSLFNFLGWDHPKA
ncbi:hypothetical protein F4779DRAFT_571520 [Xylariaceae sp. FL0662B]|nr:hypothetical protein F4779DRAFT_571520 [Xylariaceae sp. FL0662B]